MHRLASRLRGLYKIKGDKAGSRRRLLAGGLAALTVVSAVSIVFMTLRDTQAALVNAPPAIDNYKQQDDGFELEPGAPLPDNAENKWNQDYGYDVLKTWDSVYTQAVSSAYNSPAYNTLPTTRHMVQEGDMKVRSTFRFFNYASGEHLDWHYEDRALKEVLHVTWTFRMTADTDFDIIKETGVLFNGAKQSANSFYTGYTIVIMRNPSDGNKIQMWLCFLDSKLGESDAAGLSAKLQKQVLLVDNIQNKTAREWEVRIARNAATGQFYIYMKDNAELPPTERLYATVGNPLNGSSSGNLNPNSVLGFGVFTHYRAIKEVLGGKVSGNTVTALSVMEMENITLWKEDPFKPTPTYATVNFLDVQTGQPIAFPQHKPISNIPGPLNVTAGAMGPYWGYAGKDYKVLPPQYITDDQGVVWTLIRADREVLDPITYNENPNNNITNLYYDTPINLAKSAQVNGGAVNNGTQASPVSVEEDDIITYNLDLLNPRAPINAPGGGIGNPGGGNPGGGDPWEPPEEENFVAPQFTKVWNDTNMAIGKGSAGKLYSWGYNNYGQLGVGDTNNRKRPTEITYFTQNGINVVDIWIYNNSIVFAKDTNGKLYSWGYNTYGQLGVGDTNNRPEPVCITDLVNGSNGLAGKLNIVDIWATTSATSTSVYARGADGKFYSWGYCSASGQLGRGTTTLQSWAADLTVFESLTTNPLFGANTTGWFVYVVSNNIFLRTPAGELYGCGGNTYGQLGDTTTTERTRFIELTAVAGSPLNGKSVLDFYTGNDFCAVRTSDGKAITWGYNYYGVVGNGTSSTSQATPVDLTTLNIPGNGLYGETVSGLWVTGNGNTVLARVGTDEYYAWGDNTNCEAGQDYDAAKLAAYTAGIADLSIDPNVYPSVAYWSFTHRILTPTSFTGLNGKVLAKVWPGRAYGHWIVKDDNGALWTWGYGSWYQPGLGTPNSNFVPAELTASGATTNNALFGNYTVTDIWVLDSYWGVIARDAAGNYYGWGYNSQYGQLGTGDFGTKSQPVLLTPVNGLLNGGALFGHHLNRAGNWFITLNASGEAYTWGQNTYGQLGLGYWGAGADAIRNAPTWVGTPVPPEWKEYNGPPPILTRIWPGDEYIIALDEDGKFWGWGNNANGQLGIGNTINRANPTPIPALDALEPTALWAMSNYVLAKGADGKYYSWGNSSSSRLGRSGANTVPGEITYFTTNGITIAEIYPGPSWTFAKSSAGKLYAWGDNNYGQTGLGTGSATSATNSTMPFEVTGWQTVTINEGGTGPVNNQTYTNPLYNKTVSGVWAGSNFSLVVTTDGKLYSFGYNASGQCGLGYNYSPMYNSPLNTRHVYVPQEVTGWGSGTNPLFGKTIAADSTGKPMVWLNPRDSSVIVKTTENKLYSWGANTGGNLGLGDDTARNAPTEITALSGVNVVDIQRGFNTVFAKDSTGKYWVWGTNSSGQLGLGHNSNTVYTPTFVPTTLTYGLNSLAVSELKVGYYDVIFKASDGKYYGFGANMNGVLGLGDNSNKPTPTYLSALTTENITDLWMNSSSSPFVVACNADGDAIVWGTNNNCQLGIKDNTTNQFSPQMNPAYKFKDGVIIVDPDPEGVFEVTDLLPLGLELVMNGPDPWYAITDLPTPPTSPVDRSGSLGDLEVKVTEEDGRQRITFYFTVLPQGVTRFQIKAKVVDPGRYTNEAVFNGFTLSGQPAAPVPSNKTYHKAGIKTVTEYYRRVGQTIADPQLRANTLTQFDVADNGPYNYAPNFCNNNVPLVGFTANGTYWYYIGYQMLTGPDTAYHAGLPPTGKETPTPQWCWQNQFANNEIVFFYMQGVVIQVEFRSYDTDAELKPTLNVTDVDPTQPYTMQGSYMDPFIRNEPGNPGALNGQWGYYNYYWKSTGTAPAFSNKQAGKPNDPPPTFTAAQLQASPLEGTSGIPVRKIVLYFVTTLTVEYREYKPTQAGRQNGAVLYHPGPTGGQHSYVYFVPSGNFNTEDAGTTVGSPPPNTTIHGAVAAGAYSLAGVHFETYRGYSTNGGRTITYAPPPTLLPLDVPPGATLTLYFGTLYDITEKFHQADGSPVPPPTGTPDVVTTVNSGDPWTGTPKNITNWYYIGYKLGSDTAFLNPALPPKPTFPEVNGNEIIIYVYGQRQVGDPTMAKNAQVSTNNGSTWAAVANGAPGSPVEVFDNNLIRYTIRVSDLPDDPWKYNPLPDGAFAYTGAVQTFTAPASGYYRIEAWGGDGGNGPTAGGAGGYSKGNIYLTAGQKLNIYVGNVGGNGSGTTPGAGGTTPATLGKGGTGRSTSSGGGGGAATEVRFNGIATGDRVLVAGGGGGGGASAGNGIHGGQTTGTWSTTQDGLTALGNQNNGGGGGGYPLGGSSQQSNGNGIAYGGQSWIDGTKTISGATGADSSLNGQPLLSKKFNYSKLDTASYKTNPAKSSSTDTTPRAGYVVITQGEIDPFPVTIRDEIPEGLEYVSSSPQATNHQEILDQMAFWAQSGSDWVYAPVVEWERDYTGLNAAGTAPQNWLEVTVTVRVKEKGDFINTASGVAFNVPVISGPTYHRNYANYTLIERYAEYADLHNELRDPFENTVKQDSYFVTPEGHKFPIINGTGNIRYRYIGYMVDGVVHIPLDSNWVTAPGVQATHDGIVITYLYEETYAWEVTERYVELGNESYNVKVPVPETFSTTVLDGGIFGNVAAPYHNGMIGFGGFTRDAKPYVYYGYRIDNMGGSASTGFTDGLVVVGSWPSAQLTIRNDVRITYLYNIANSTVTERYVEQGTNANVKPTAPPTYETEVQVGGIFGADDYHGWNRDFDPFVMGGVTYEYIGYQIGAAAPVLTGAWPNHDILITDDLLITYFYKKYVPPRVPDEPIKRSGVSEDDGGTFTPDTTSTTSNYIEDDAVVVKPGNQIKYDITVDYEERALPPRVVDSRSFGPQTLASNAPAAINFVNGSFEEPDCLDEEEGTMATENNPWGLPNFQNPSGLYADYADVPGWYSVPTDSDNIDKIHWSCIQYMYVGGSNCDGTVPYPNGTQFAELNAHYPSRLYQICQTTPGTRIYWSLWHQACQHRNGEPYVFDSPANENSTDTLNVYIYGTPDPTPGPDGKAVGDSTANRAAPPAGALQKQCTTAVGEKWKPYSGYYEVPAGQTSTILAFESPASYTGRLDFGNYLDDIRLYTNSYLVLNKTADKTKADFGDTVTYTVSVKNHGESDASQTVFTDALPPGMDYVANSAKVDGVTVPGTPYNAGSHTLTIPLGNIKGVGSLSTDCKDEYVVTFQATVNGEEISKTISYQNQAKAVYFDRGHEDEGESVSYSNLHEIPLEMQPYSGKIVDVLPEGLTIVSHTDGTPPGTYNWNAATRTITWTWAEMPTGKTTVSVTVEVDAKQAVSKPVFTNQADFFINNSKVDSTNEVWHVAQMELKLHIRQIVIGPTSSLSWPGMGYYTLLNEGKILPLTSNSLVLPEFTDYTLIPGDNRIYKLTDIVPQYFKFVGHVQNDGESAVGHPEAAPYTPMDTTPPNGQIELNYTETGEIWITVYITPEGAPGKQQTSVETNKFGTVYKKKPDPPAEM